MAVIVGNIGNKDLVEFKPVRLNQRGQIEYIPEQSIRLYSNRAGGFRIRLYDRLYDYLVGTIRQFVISVPSGSLVYQVDTLKVATFEENERGDQKDLPYVLISGSEMTGSLILSGHPEENDDDFISATKGYVDREIANQVRQVKHRQTTPAYVWRIEHNLGVMPVIVTTYDTPSGDQQRFLADNRYIDENVIEVRLNHARTGTITLQY